MDLCQRRSLRGGALPFGPAVRFLLESGLVIQSRESVSLTREARDLLHLIDRADEPSVELVHLLTALMYARRAPNALAQERASLDVSGAETDLDLLDLGLLVPAEHGLRPPNAIAGLLIAGFRNPTPQPPPDFNAIGDLAERLSMQYLQRQNPQGAVVRVSLQSNRFGFDILVVAGDTHGIAYEVKGSTALKDIAFFLSRNEVLTGTQLQERYTLHIWGGLSLGQDFDQQYARLVADGFPRVVRNPSKTYAGCWRIPRDCVAPNGHRFRPTTFEIAIP